MVPMTTWSALWPDGSKTVGRSGTEVILRVAQAQWPMPDGAQVDHQTMKNQLSNRAQGISGKYVHPHQPDDPFVRELHRVGLIDLTLSDDA